MFVLFEKLPNIVFNMFIYTENDTGSHRNTQNINIKTKTYKKQENGNNSEENSGTIYEKSVSVRILVPIWGAPGSKKTPDTKKYNKIPEKCEMVVPPGPHFEHFSVIFVSWGCKLTHLRNRLFLGPWSWGFLVVWQGENGSIVCVLLCQTHISHFGTKCVLSWFSHLFGPQLGSLLACFVHFWVTFWKYCFLPLLWGTGKHQGIPRNRGSEMRAP